MSEVDVKPLPPPPVPGTTESERFDNAVRMVLSVPKEAFDKAEARLKRMKSRKKKAGARTSRSVSR